MTTVANIVEYSYDPARLDRLEAVLPAAEQTLLETFEQQPGYLASITIDRGGGHCMRLTLWESAEAANAAAFENNEQVREAVMNRFRPQIQPFIAAPPTHSQATVVCYRGRPTR